MMQPDEPTTREPNLDQVKVIARSGRHQSGRGFNEDHCGCHPCRWTPRNRTRCRGQNNWCPRLSGRHKLERPLHSEGSGNDWAKLDDHTSGTGHQSAVGIDLVPDKPEVGFEQFCTRSIQPSPIPILGWLESAKPPHQYATQAGIPASRCASARRRGAGRRSFCRAAHGSCITSKVALTFHSVAARNCYRIGKAYVSRVPGVFDHCPGLA